MKYQTTCKKFRKSDAHVHPIGRAVHLLSKNSVTTFLKTPDNVTHKDIHVIFPDCPKLEGCEAIMGQAKIVLYSGKT